MSAVTCPTVYAAPVIVPMHTFEDYRPSRLSLSRLMAIVHQYPGKLNVVPLSFVVKQLPTGGIVNTNRFGDLTQHRVITVVTRNIHGKVLNGTAVSLPAVTPHN